MKTIDLVLMGWWLFMSNHHHHHLFARALTSDGRLVVVQLGDSFAAGNGARDANGAVNYAGIPECYRSSTTWGAQATALLPPSQDGLAAVYVSRACSGGIIADLTKPRYFSTRNTSKVNGVCSATPAPPFAPEEFYIESYLSSQSLSCVNALQPQLLGVTKETDIVLIATAGNNFGIDSIVRSCLAPSTRTIPRCLGFMDFVYGTLNPFGTALTNVLLSIQPLLHDTAIVVVVAYPHIVLNTPMTLDPEPGYNKLDITDNWRSLGNIVEQRQRAAVAAANKNSTREFAFFYNGTKPLFEGHEPHPNFQFSNEDRWINEFSPEGGNTAEVFQLNPIGHVELGRAVGAFLTSRLVPAAPTAPQTPTRSPIKTPATGLSTKAPSRSPTKAPVAAAPMAAPTGGGLRPPTKAPVAALRLCGGLLQCLFRRVFRCRC
jgi:hypothetical protein